MNTINTSITDFFIMSILAPVCGNILSPFLFEFAEQENFNA